MHSWQGSLAGRRLAWGQLLPVALLMPLMVGCLYRLPPGYVKVEPPFGVEFRAVSADGSALTLRSEKNPENGDLAFWEKAVKARLVDVRGYRLTTRSEATLGRGTRVVEMAFDYNRDGIDYLYLLTMCIRGDRVHIFEAAGEKGKIAPDLPVIKQAIHDWPM